MLLCPWDSPGKNTGVGCHLPSPGDLLHPGIETAAPATPSLQANSLPGEPQRGAGWGSPCCRLHPCSFIYLSCAGSLLQSMGSVMQHHADRAFSSCHGRVGSGWGASLVVGHGLECTGMVAAVWASRLVERVPSCPAACDPLVSQPRIEPTSRSLAGGLSTTGPPGKFCNLFIYT